MRDAAANLVKRHWALLVAIAFFWLAIGILLIRVMAVSGGQIVYGLDDPYIHMAMAKNLAGHGVWGVTSYEFSSSSSSPLWTMLLAVVYFVTGVHEITPLILNVIFATILLITVYWVFIKNGMIIHQAYVYAALLVMIFAIPLPTLALIGMDTTLQVLIDVLFVYLVVSELSQGKPRRVDVSLLVLIALAMLVSTVRYEGFFIVFGALVLFAARRRWLLSAAMAAAAVLPLGIFGLISEANGDYWLPNSVLIKGGGPNLMSSDGIIHLIHVIYFQILQRPAYLFVFIVALLFYIYRLSLGKGFWERGQLMLSMFVNALIFHLVFIKSADFYRYDAYLIALGLFVLIPVVYETFIDAVRKKKEWLATKYGAIALLCLVVLVPLGERGFFCYQYIPQASKNIFEQQYQMGLFLQQYYQGATVAANDIGAINFLADIKNLDLAGLGSIEVTRAILAHNLNRGTINEIAQLKGVKIAIVYDGWFQDNGGMPSQWVQAGCWRIFNNVTCGGDVVSFYAVDPAEAPQLKANLKAFSTRLPADVYQSGSYLQ